MMRTGVRGGALVAMVLAACGGDGGGAPDARPGDAATEADAAADGALDALVDAPPAGPRTLRVSVTSAGGEAHGNSGDLPTISGDGRFVVFTSDAPDLVADDTNGTTDVFLHDRTTQATTRLNVGPTAEANVSSSTGWISRSGRFVCFSSGANNLIASDTNNAEDAFLLDRTTGVIERVSVTSSEVAGTAGSTCSGVSDDGRFVNFYSYASNLGPGDSGNSLDAFVRDRQLGTTVLASATASGTPGNGTTIGSMLAGDGSFIVFGSSSTDLVTGDTNGAYDIFERASDGESPAVLISRTPGGAPGNAASNVAFVSSDGSTIAYLSGASNLVTGDTNGFQDIFVFDRASGVTERVSVGMGGAEANGHSENPKLSHDGRLVLFISHATNLVPGDTNGKRDAFLYDRMTATTVRVSLGAADEQTTETTYYASLADDGSFAVFTTPSANLVPGDTNADNDVFLRDLRAVALP